MQTFSEMNKIVPLALAPDADRFDADPASDVIFLTKAKGVCFVVAEGAGGTGTATITIQACDDATPSNTSAIAFRYRTLTTAGGLDTWGAWQNATSSGVTPGAGAGKATLVEVRSDELPAGYPAVRLKLTESADDPVDAAVFAVVYDLDYAGNQSPSVLA